MRAVRVDEHDDVERVGVEAELREQRAADLRLQRREAEARGAVALEHEAHRAVTQVADAVEEHDRVLRGVGERGVTASQTSAGGFSAECSRSQSIASVVSARSRSR